MPQQTLLEEVRAMRQAAGRGHIIAGADLHWLLIRVETAMESGATPTESPLDRALFSMSHCERQAARAIAEALPDEGGTVIAGKLAKQIGFGRSAFVIALQKLSAAGVVETSRLGCNGTNVRPLVTGWRQAILAT